MLVDVYYFITSNGELCHCDEFYHHGIKGMKWGVRRFQRRDGTRTPAGKKRMAFTQSDGYRNALRKVMSNKTINKAATNLTKRNMTKTSRKEAISKEKDKDVRLGMKMTKGSASEVKKGLDAANKKVAEKRQGSNDKKSNYKKAVKIGAAVAGTALAAYGTYKVAKFIQGKRSEAAMQKASEYVSKNFLNKIGESNFSNGQTISNFANKTGTSMVVKGRGNRDIGKYNARVVSTGRQIYKDATNTKFDRGLSKVVGAGDAVRNASKRAGSAAVNAAKKSGNAARRTATTAKNRVLDAVNPLYEYTPGESGSTTRMIDGLKVTTGFTNYKKRKIRR